MLRHKFIQSTLKKQNFLGMYFNVRSLSLKTTHWLMNHDARIRQAKALSLCTSCQEKRSHACGLPYAKRTDIRFNELHGVVNRHPGGYQPTRRIDIKMNVLIRIF